MYGDIVIRQAIMDWRLLEFTYLGRHRICEPHIFGAKGGKDQLLAYQVGGSSELGALPGWNRFDVALMERPRAMRETFDGPRETATIHPRDFDVVYAAVK